MARNTLKLSTSGLEEYLKKLHHVGGNVQQAVADALEQSSETIKEDTEEALSATFLPRQGKFSHGLTKESVIQDTTVRWEGLVAWVPVGFDFSDPGAGGYLITGTPRMNPDKKLHQMYKQRRYMNQIQKDMLAVIEDYIADAMVKGK